MLPGLELSNPETANWLQNFTRGRGFRFQSGIQLGGRSPTPCSVVIPPLDGNLVVWQHEYAVWQVINLVVGSAEQILTRDHVNRGVFLGTAATPSECSVSSFGASHGLLDLPTIIIRLATCLDFVDACLLVSIFSQLHSHPVLQKMEILKWSPVTV